MKQYEEDEVRKWVEKYLVVLAPENHKGDIFCMCPECGTEELKFSVNVRKQVFNCWRGTCKFKGSSLEPLFKIFGPIEDLGYDLKVEKAEIPEEGSPIIQYPFTKEGYFKIWEEKFIPMSSFPQYDPQVFMWKGFFDSRRIKYEDILEGQTKVCLEGFEEEKDYGRLSGYFGFPYRDREGKTIYFQFRQIPSFKRKIKWKFPKFVDDFSSDKFIFFVDPVNEYPDRVLCESLLDGYRIGKFSCSVGGAYLSESHLSIFTKLRCKRLFLILDGDEAGKKATFTTACLLQDFTFSQILIPPRKYFSLDMDPDEFDDSQLSSLLSSCSEFHRSIWS